MKILNQKLLSRTLLLSAVITGAFINASGASALTIDNTSSWNGSSSVQPWVASITETIGQVITPAVSGKLTDFTFFLKPDLSSAPIIYQARVFEWDYTGGANFYTTTGPSLYNSGPLSFSGIEGSYSPVTINTGGVSLIAGIPYVLFFSMEGESNPSDYSASWGFHPGIGLSPEGDVYPEGEIVFTSRNPSFTGPWGGFGNARADLVFKANFNQVNEVPGPLPLFGVAAAICFSRRLRRRISVHKLDKERRQTSKSIGII